MHFSIGPDSIQMMWDASKEEWKGVLVDWDLHTPTRTVRIFSSSGFSSPLIFL